MTKKNERRALYQIETTQFEVRYADITTVEADAIVSSDDHMISMVGGVSAAIRRAGGDWVRDDAQKHVPASIGSVVVSSAGELPAKYVFHGITIDFLEDRWADAAVLTTIVNQALHLAEVLGVKRISFPALGTGSAFLPFQQAAKAMVGAIAEYLSKDTTIDTVTLCLYAKSGAESSDIDLFYEEAGGLMAVFAQNQALSALLSDMRKLLGDTGRPDVLLGIDALQAKIQQTNTNISQQMQGQDDTAGEQDIHQGAFEDLQREIGHYTQKAAAPSEDKEMEIKFLQTKLSGLYTTLNIKQSQLNHYEVEEAKYGGIMVPPRLSMAIADLKAEMALIEQGVADAKAQLAAIG